MRALSLLAVMIFLATLGTAWAHHSLAPVYDMAQTATVEGRLTTINFVNPHVSYEVSVRGTDGAPKIWRIESRSTRGMDRAGISARTMKIGSLVKFTGHPGRNGALMLWPTSLEAGGATFDLRRRPAPPAP